KLKEIAGEGFAPTTIMPASASRASVVLWGRPMNASDVLKTLEPLGAESYRKVLRNHGIKDPMFGVKISELKKIQKRAKKDHRLALDLYATGNYDAMYLAGLIA